MRREFNATAMCVIVRDGDDSKVLFANLDSGEKALLLFSDMSTAEAYAALSPDAAGHVAVAFPNIGAVVDFLESMVNDGIHSAIIDHGRGAKGGTLADLRELLTAILRDGPRLPD